MALFGQFGNTISTAFQQLGMFGGGTGAVGQIGSSLLSALAPSVGPTIATAQPIQPGRRIPARPAAVFSGSVMTMLVAPILFKIATTLGRTTMSLRGALKIIKRMGKFLEPAAIGAALGIGTGELAQLILAGSQMPRRRMNPANSSALRRAARRIESFHRLCVRTDQLRSRGGSRRRRAPAPSAGQRIVQVK